MNKVDRNRGFAPLTQNLYITRYRQVVISNK